LSELILSLRSKQMGRNKFAPYRPRDAMRVNDARSTAEDQRM